MQRDIEFSGPELTTVRIQGRDYQVGPLTMGQRRRLVKAMAKVPPPKTVQVDVQGLVEAMLRASDESVDSEDKIQRGMRAAKLRQQALPEIVLQAIREARAVAEMWPPDPADVRGLMLIADNPDIYQEFLCVVLHQHDPTFTVADAARMAGNVGPDQQDQSLSVIEHSRLMNAVLIDPARQLAEKDSEAEVASDEGAGPKSSISGGESVTSAHPGNLNPPITLNSTVA